MNASSKNTPTIAAICAAHGVENVIICPGSRSAPITLAFVRSQKFLCHTVVDERTAGYIALGMAQQTQQPVVIICTSGTAALNLSPALAEAFYARVPLIVLTADRPEAWIDQGDGQTIRQARIFESFTIKSYHLSGDNYHSENLWHVQRSVNEALIFAKSRKGPVHINLSLCEPLYDVPILSDNTIHIVKSAYESVASYEEIPMPQDLKLWVLVGQQQTDAQTAYILEKGIRDYNWVVVAESLANLFIPSSIQNIQETIASGTSHLQPPNVLLSIGGAIISKKLKQYLRSLETLTHIHVDDREELMDTFCHLSYQYKGTAMSFLSKFIELPRVSEKDFFEQWMIQSQIAQSAVHTFYGIAPYSDWTAFHCLLSAIPAHSVLHLGNSTPVRYAQIFHATRTTSIISFCNRGVSGIDGIVSTAVGHALADCRRKHYVITGDLSMQYDMNSLWVERFPENLTIIIINNRGGSIFRLIEGAQNVEELENYFETRHQINSFKHMAKHFGISYMCCKDLNSLENACHNLTETTAAIIEIQTNPEISAQTFADFYQYLRKNSR
ncbi:MAG: 2-succinyl-5-enolpyruvyl-6-hydroxy-3-cyclohexene-1-carboxylic-acid synthase [Candidatus Competibacteraceae bacterium]|nr:2-succinyl-5-enolpyruvyl-6-hydroxy-3-cyclohexene-1-carboxylic-acid synthase [Candidatus Competibacteraceae bacterium]